MFAAPLARSLSLEQPYLPALIVLESFGMAMLTFYNSVLSVDYKYKEYLVLSLVYAVAGIGGSVLLILTLCRGQGYLGRILGTLIPAVLVGIYVVFRLWRKDRPRISREYWRYGMAISLPTVPHGLSQLLLNQFDRIMIKSIIGSTEAGLYSFAYNVGMIFQVITNSMDTAWAPWFFEKMKAREYPAIRRAASAYVVFVSIGAMALALISPEVILIAGGSKYSDSRYVTMPIVLSMYYAFLYTLPSSVEYYYKKTKLIALGTMLAAGMNILLNAVFIPAFGYVAAAYTTVACYLLYYLLHVALSWWVHKGMVYDILQQFLWLGNHFRFPAAVCRNQRRQRAVSRPRRPVLHFRRFLLRLEKQKIHPCRLAPDGACRHGHAFFCRPLRLRTSLNRPAAVFPHSRRR